MDLDYESSVLSSGAVVHCWKVTDARSILILQHGFAEYAERFVDGYHQVIRRLVEVGIEVWAMDMWGHGRSPGIRSMVNVTKAVEDHQELRVQVGKRGLPVYLFGHSLGGLVTVGSTIMNPCDIRGVILTGPALPSIPPMFLRGILGVCASFLPTREIPVKRQPLSGISSLSEEVQKAKDDASLFKGNVSFLTAKTALQTVDSAWRKIGTWTIPTIILHGLDDKYTDPKQSERFMNSITSNDKTICLVPEGRHELLNDSMRDEMLQIILKWLDERIQRLDPKQSDRKYRNARPRHPRSRVKHMEEAL